VSKLKLINEALKGKSLKGNPLIIEAGRAEKTELPRGNESGFQHEVDIFLGCKPGVYHAKRLQEIMEALAPSIQPTSKSNFYISGGKDIAFGWFFFDETIGHVNMDLEEGVYEELSSLSRDGKVVRDSLQRRTRIYLYPDEAIAHKAYRSRIGHGDETKFDRYAMSLKDLYTYQRKPGIFPWFVSLFRKN